MKKIIFIGLIVAIGLILILAFSSGGDKETVLTTSVLRGNLQIEVITTGELEARNSVKILGPGQQMSSARIWNTKINEMVPEGTEVKKGQFVAQLDVSGVEDNIKNRVDDLTKAESEHTTTKLDTTLTMREQRDKLLNLKFAVEEKKIKLEQSAFEPPATIKQAKMEVEKAQRELDQHKENYGIKKQQMIAKMNVATAKLERSKRLLHNLQGLKTKFTITAPEDGMVIYAKNWHGHKVKTGEQVRHWNPIVATLPDMSEMISRTYVNEIDIRKVKIGQQVQIGLDAFPDKALTGEIITVANVGEQKPNSDSKVFEVSIVINEYDSILRPSMTTSNNILTNQIDNCLYVPLEALHSQGDTVNYVIEKDGLSYTKKEVELGPSNGQYAVILKGTEEGRTLALNETESLKEKEVEFLK